MTIVSLWSLLLMLLLLLLLLLRLKRLLSIATVWRRRGAIRVLYRWRMGGILLLLLLRQLIWIGRRGVRM